MWNCCRDCLLDRALQVHLVVTRTETEIDERLLRRESHKDKIKVQYTRIENDRLAAKLASDASAKTSSVCNVS